MPIHTMQTVHPNANCRFFLGWLCICFWDFQVTFPILFLNSEIFLEGLTKLPVMWTIALFQNLYRYLSCTNNKIQMYIWNYPPPPPKKVWSSLATSTGKQDNDSASANRFVFHRVCFPTSVSLIIWRALHSYVMWVPAKFTFWSGLLK